MRADMLEASLAQADAARTGAHSAAVFLASESRHEQPAQVEIICCSSGLVVASAFMIARRMSGFLTPAMQSRRYHQRFRSTGRKLSRPVVESVACFLQRVWKSDEILAKPWRPRRHNIDPLSVLGGLMIQIRATILNLELDLLKALWYCRLRLCGSLRFSALLPMCIVAEAENDMVQRALRKARA